MSHIWDKAGIKIPQRKVREFLKFLRGERL
jgi:hypothetical protein